MRIGTGIAYSEANLIKSEAWLRECAEADPAGTQVILECIGSSGFGDAEGIARAEGDAGVSDP